MKLILIHGRAQEEFDEKELKQTWINTLNEGLKKSNLTLPENVSIEFPYYGKLLDKLVQEAKSAPVVASRSVRSGLPNTEAAELVFLQDLLGEMAGNMNVTMEEQAELAALQAKTRGPLNWGVVQRLFTFIDTKQKFGDTILKKFTLDAFMYLTVNDIRKQIDDHIIQCFDDEPCVVVGHSLGSVISYLVLKNNPQLQVKHYFTVGSPLGLTAFQKYLERPLLMPPCVKAGWFNAYDDRDFVALNPLNQQYFNIKPPVENKSDVDNHTDNRHGIIGYLNDKVVAQRIYAALMEG